MRLDGDMLERDPLMLVTIARTNSGRFVGISVALD
jgi:hypothetical protein